jgi:dimethylargininase
VILSTRAMTREVRDDRGSPGHPVSMRIFDFNSAILREPATSIVMGLRAGEGPAPDYAGVVAEHRAYADALRAAGVDVTILPALEEYPDSMFVEDPALVFTRAAILLNPGAPSRAAEGLELVPELERRFPRVLRLREGHADGGDVLVTPNRVFIGLSARTDAAGAAAVQRLLASIGWASELLHVPSGTLHLKTACSLVDEDTILTTRAIASSRLLDGYRLLVAPEEESDACNAIRVNDVVLMRAGCPRTHEMLTAHGLDVVTLSTDEIAKVDAGLSCMSLRWFG